LLMGVTLYIYMPWFIVKQKKFFATNTRVQVRDRVYAGDFHGNGGELFGTAVGGFLLTMITAGIYAPWFIVNLLKFNINNTSFQVQPGQSSIGGGGAHGQLTA
ncbi:MAG: DUF898 family protein, partial [Myxococcales bacterium]|nr:DUF898 family protein [Myxococcales bacterium]